LSLRNLAHLRWQKYRMHKMYIAAAYGDPFVSDLIKGRHKSWAGMRSQLKTDSITGSAMSDLMNGVFMEQTEKVAETMANALRDGKWSDWE
jgi:hypothetical protein